MTAALRIYTGDPAPPPAADQAQNWTRLPDAALDDRDLSPSALRTLAGVLRGVYSGADLVVKTVQQIADDAGQAKSTAERGLRQLQERGYLERTDQAGRPAFRLRFRLKGPLKTEGPDPSKPRGPALKTEGPDPSKLRDRPTIEVPARASGENPERTSGGDAPGRPVRAETPARPGAGQTPEPPPDPATLALAAEWARRPERDALGRLGRSILARAAESTPAAGSLAKDPRPPGEVTDPPIVPPPGGPDKPQVLRRFRAAAPPPPGGEKTTGPGGVTLAERPGPVAETDPSILPGRAGPCKRGRPQPPPGPAPDGLRPA